MMIRILTQNEILPALNFAWAVYSLDVAPKQMAESVREFRELIQYENMNARIERGEVVLFGAFDEGQLLCGVSAVDNSGEILFICIKREAQRQGVGRALMQRMSEFCSQVLVITRMTMKVVPSALDVMEHLGMKECGIMQNMGIAPFVPMDMMISPAAMKPESNNKKKVALIVAGIAAIFILLIAVIVKMVYTGVKNSVEESGFSEDYYMEPFYEYEEEFGNGYDDNGDKEPEGIAAISEYHQKGLDFEIEEENYLYTPDDTKTTYIDFEIFYPQINGLKEEVQEKVNEELKTCAMETVERIYNHPDVEFKEKILGEQYPVIASYVHYKVTYLSEDLISVVFEDYSYEGSESDTYVRLRTKNINLKDGTVYEVKDIVKLQDDFLKEWREVMQEEADTDMLLSELSLSELKKVLSGQDDMGDIYSPNFFLDKEGIEIGLSFHYPEGDENDLGYGWVTAPFRLEELVDYRTENTFWELLNED